MEAFVIRAASLYLPITAACILWISRRPNRRELGGIIIACLWVTPSLLLVHILAQHFSWWKFEAEGGLLLGFPVDLYLGWVVLWGVIPTLAFREMKLVLVITVMFLIDLFLMPLGNPVVQLSHSWIVGEIAALAIVLTPAILLSYWVKNDIQLNFRATLIGIGFLSVLFWWLPSVIFEVSQGNWSELRDPPWINAILVLLLVVPGLIGLSAVQEFVVKGQGTPIPFDPPKRLVQSGIYAYIANPMQLATALSLAIWGVILRNPLVTGASIVAVVYGLGLANWSEDIDLKERFGEGWNEYRCNVKNWIPRNVPWFSPKETIPVLYVAEDCAPCSQVARWFAERKPLHLKNQGCRRPPIT